MTDDQQHGQGGAPQGGGRWDPLPQGDYDDGATAFVTLPEGGIDALLAGDSPLAAPGHGYVPPQITVAPAGNGGTDPASTGTGSWAIPAGGAEWPDPAAPTADDRFTYNPGATGQWTFEEPAAAPAPAPGHDVTGQWSIPVAGGDLPDESGEFTTSSLVEQWGGTPPATLPGGAPAPWATEPQGEPWGQPPAEADGGDRGGAGDGTGDYGALVERVAEHGGAPTHPGETGHTRVPHPAGATHPDTHPDTHPAGDTARDAASHAGVPHVDASAVPAEPSYEPAPGAVEAVQHASGAAEAHGGPEGARGPREAAEAEAVEATGTAHARVTDSTDGADGADGPDASPEAAPPAPFPDEHPLASYVLRVNEADRPVTDAWIGESLLYVLRERLGLAGAKDGCSQGECGACNVQVDGRLVASCLVPAVTTAGAEIRTVEGLAVDGQSSDVQRALARCGAVQCGFCVPGMAMTVHDLLEGNPAPTELETRQALCGNLCRCSGYRGVVRAVQEVVAEREAHAAGDESDLDGDEARIPHQAGPGAGGIHRSAFEAPGAMAPHHPQHGQPHDQPHDQAYGPQDGGQA